MKKKILIAVAILIIAIVAFLYYRGGLLQRLYRSAPVSDPYEAFRANTRPYSERPDGDGIWHEMHVMFDPETGEEHAALHRTADAFLKGYDLGPTGWEFRQNLAADFEEFLAEVGYMSPATVAVGEFVYV